MITRLKNGQRAIILDDKVKAAFLTTVGDTDHDGKDGVRAIALVDIPFDGDDFPKPVFDSGEQLEDADTATLARSVGQALTYLGGIADGALRFLKLR